MIAVFVQRETQGRHGLDMTFAKCCKKDAVGTLPPLMCYLAMPDEPTTDTQIKLRIGYAIE
jgi:hypothetical protein